MRLPPADVQTTNKELISMIDSYVVGDNVDNCKNNVISISIRLVKT